MENRKPLLLVTNDDGITAPGLRHLINILTTIGEVFVVAPDKPQSAKSHAITIEDPLHFDPIIIDPNGTQKEYKCSGTPVDCIKLGTRLILDRKPDLCISGINHGSNAAINVLYSGTMGAAIEGGIQGIPSIGFSLLDYSHKASLNHTTNPIKKIVKSVLQNGLSPGVVLNVNIPSIEKSPIQGIKICKQAASNWSEKFEQRTSPMGRNYYWMSGDFLLHEVTENSDAWALENGFISVVPTTFDLTAHDHIQTLQKWSL